MKNVTEKISIKGKAVWIAVDPHVQEQPGQSKEEYFTASYYTEEPSVGMSGIIFETGGQPVIFESPVQALEYANEKLLELI